MDPKSGDKFGDRFTLLSKLGSGGMGEVWKARDTELDRDVALKVSKAEFTARFKQEARAMAAFSHPNICQIYDVGPNYIVMELIDGVQLSGPLPVEKAVGYAAQILDALDAAHRKTFTHRDLKPANVMVTKSGILKLLDFGLAKQNATGLGPDDETGIALTKQGQITGTLQYMSPEQLNGKEADARSDIFAFGCVLYEMLSGKKAFSGSTNASVIAAIIEREPEPLQTAPPLDRVIRTCLAKDPDERFQSARDAKKAMLWAMEGGRAAPSQSRLGKAGWIAAAVFVVIAAGVSFVHFRETTPADPVLHLSVQLPGNAPAPFLALSPDGRRLVIMLVTEGKQQLWMRALDSPQLQLLPGTDGARVPFWSPDSKSIGFFADGKLKVMLASGGPPQVLCEGTGNGGGGTWNRNGVILFSTAIDGDPIRRVNASGRACIAVTQPEGGGRLLQPAFLPDGTHFVYAVFGGAEAKQGLYLAALDHPAPRRLLGDVSSAVFAPSTSGKKYGYLLFMRGRALMAQPFSAETLELAGDAFTVAAEASFSFTNRVIAASASAGGILIYETNLVGSGFQLTWLDRSGKDVGKIGSVQMQQQVSLSPDGKTVASVRRNDGTWLYDVQRGGETRFTTTLTGGAPVWSPKGNTIAFGSGKDLYLKDANGGSKEELLLEGGNVKAASDWSRDGRYLIYTETDPKGKGDIWYLPDPLDKSGERKPVKFQGTEATESQGQLSPDGRWLAYASDESGQLEVYVRPFPSGPGRWKVSVGRGAGMQPRWRPDGKELFFLEVGFPINRLMAVAVQSGSGGDFLTGTPHELFEFRSVAIIPTGNAFLYSPSADGQRFLVTVEAGDTTPTLNVISNWEKAALGGK